MQPEDWEPCPQKAITCHSWARWIQFTTSFPSSSWSILKLSSHLWLGLSSGLFLSDLPTKSINRVIRHDCRGFNKNGHLVLQMQPHVISFYGFTSRIRFMFLLFPQVSRNWRYEPEPPLKPSPLTCYKQFRTNSIIVLMFVESQRVHI